MEEIDLKTFFSTIWNKKIEIILILAVFIMLGVTYTTSFVSPKYIASTTLVLSNSENTNMIKNTITTTDLTLNSKLLSTYRVLVRSKSVLRQVIKNLNIDITEEELKKNVTVSAVQNTEVIKISVTNEDKETAAKIANEIAKVFSEEVNKLYNINNITIVDKANVNNETSNLNPTRDILIFLAIGLVVSLFYIIFSTMFDTTIKSQSDIEKAFNVLVLATIPYESDKGGKRK